MFYWLHVPVSRPAEWFTTTRHAVIRFTSAKARSDAEEADAEEADAEEANAVAFDIICMFKAEYRKRFFSIVCAGRANYIVGGGNITLIIYLVGDVRVFCRV